MTWHNIYFLPDKDTVTTHFSDFLLFLWATVPSSCVHIASITVKTPCHSHFERISVQLWAAAKTLFSIMCFCVWAVSELTCGSLNEMFTQIPHIPPRGHAIRDDTFFLWVVEVHKQQWESYKPLCTIRWVSSGLITTDNHCHSFQLWNKMIKLWPTFTFFLNLLMKSTAW